MENTQYTVLVTGGTGPLGTYVVRALLAQGHNVCVLDIKPFSIESRFLLGGAAEAVEVVLGSVDDLSRVVDIVMRRRPKRIIHMAAIQDAPFHSENPKTGFRVNVEGTLNVLEAVRMFEVERLIYVSTMGVLPAAQFEPINGAHPIFLPTDAGMRVTTAGLYAASKIASEAYCFGYKAVFGVDFRIIRPSAVYGFGMRTPARVKPIVEGAVRGERVRIGSGAHFSRDFTHAADVANLVVAVLDAPADADRIFYGATGGPLVTIAEVARIVRDLVPTADIAIAGEFAPVDDDEFECGARFSIENAQSQLDWKPTLSSMRDGLADYIERYRAFLADAPQDPDG